MPVPLIELPRARRLVTRWDSVLVEMTDGRVLGVPFDYTLALDEALPDAQQRVLTTQWGLVLVWPDVPYSVTLRRLLVDAKAGRAPWGDPPTTIP
ncbi:hypothetical protein BH09GEM1_BH09GEM1_07310 [soil metagenome]